MQIAIYARVSSESQAKDGTIQSQLEILRDYAKSKSLTILEECIDDGYSGADLNRPGLDQLRDLSVEGILVLSPDRLARKQAHQIILLEEFKKRHIKVIFSSQQFEDNAEGNLMLQIQGAISEFERAKILDRTRRGSLHATRNGQVKGGNAPYGYTFVKKTGEAPATYAIDEQEAEIVRMIFDWYLHEGMKGTAIAKRLEQEGIPSRSKVNKWWSSTVYAILKNETYTGTAHMYKTKSVEPGKHPKIKKYRQRRKSSKTERPKDDWIPISVPQIIERETWEAAQKQLQNNAITSRRNNRKNNYLLRGLVVCGLCGSMAPGYVSNKKTYYCCGAKRNKNITTTPHDERIAVDHKTLDQKVWQGLTELLNDPDKLKEQMQSKLDQIRQPQQIDHAAITKLDKEIKKLSVQESRIIDAYREGVINLEELQEQKATISKRLQVVEANKNAVLSQQNDSGQGEITIDMLGDVSERFQRIMSKADFSTREKIANLLINRVTLKADRAIVEGNIPIDPDALVPAKHASPVLKT
ncbi:MAG: recombinase family protein [Chloroflexi bacterium]|nr:recombinase family protein [Chloroflexota bacterium]